jgi:ribosomal protein L11 methyltransferase
MASALETEIEGLTLCGEIDAFAGADADDSGPTRRLALAAIERLVKPGMRVLDAGCGDGPLARAAVARGATVRAVDHDPNAIVHAWASGVAAELSRIEDLVGDYDVVVANLWADDIVRLARELASHVAVGGRLYVTGARLWQCETIKRAFEGLSVERTEALDGWCGVELRKV